MNARWIPSFNLSYLCSLPDSNTLGMLGKQKQQMLYIQDKAGIYGEELHEL